MRDLAKRVGLLELTTLWSVAPYGSDISDWIDEMRFHGQQDAEIADKLELCVRNARLPMGIVYDGCVIPGSSGIKLDEDILARRLVADEQLVFSAASFWSYDGKGLWERENDPLRIEAVIRDALRAAGGGELITRARVSSIYGLAKSVNHMPVERMNCQPEWYGECGKWFTGYKDRQAASAPGRIYDADEGASQVGSLRALCVLVGVVRGAAPGCGNSPCYSGDVWLCPCD